MKFAGQCTTLRNSLSVLRIESISNGPPVTVRFPSSANRNYTLLHGSNVTSAADAAVPGQVNIPGTNGMQEFQDTNAVAPRFYRVRVSRP